ncbi:hypothetical protein WR164_00990 [Philodulcilactobacillus myokoensis]|uniref:Uncharacterized protein n=1 Tax=Philodulcilactobacillus myokoensis TaxID=2929573 RepID=A0A9W6AYV5_9LACO|nr:hypothetical protein [Philodulcilactobacillus myokoensis]GLB46120.1 hypothetical protein WR164_00990 [Philodulcilactobacillus myokoensis]
MLFYIVTFSLLLIVLIGSFFVTYFTLKGSQSKNKNHFVSIFNEYFYFTNTNYESKSALWLLYFLYEIGIIIVINPFDNHELILLAYFLLISVVFIIGYLKRKHVLNNSEKINDARKIINHVPSYQHELMIMTKFKLNQRTAKIMINKANKSN